VDTESKLEKRHIVSKRKKKLGKKHKKSTRLSEFITPMDIKKKSARNSVGSEIVMIVL